MKTIYLTRKEMPKHNVKHSPTETIPRKSGWFGDFKKIYSLNISAN